VPFAYAPSGIAEDAAPATSESGQTVLSDAPEFFVVETQPGGEQNEPDLVADGGAFEDSPAVADADGDTKPEDAQ
jgi:hypothetical protein